MYMWRETSLSPLINLYNGEIVSYTLSLHPNLLMVTDMMNKVTKGVKENTHFIDIIPKYRELISDKGDGSFIDLTFEELFDLFGKRYIGNQGQKWVEYLKSRYIL